MKRTLQTLTNRQLYRAISWAEDERLREMEEEKEEEEEEEENTNDCAGCRRRFCPPDCPLL